MNTLQIFKYQQEFKLESGKKLPELEIGFHTYGKLNKDRDNVVWVCHALTANSDVFDWWKGLFGENNYSYNRQSGELWLLGNKWLVIGAKDEGSEKYI